MLSHDQLAPFADLAGNHFFARARKTRRRPGGRVERIFLDAPEKFGMELEPPLKAARASVLADDPTALSPRPHDDARAREIVLAKIRLERRITVRADGFPPLLHWTHRGLFVCLPVKIPEAESRAAVRVWLPRSGESAFACAVRVDETSFEMEPAVREWRDDARQRGIDAIVWRCELPRCCEASVPIVVEIAPDPHGYIEGLKASHSGTAVIVVGDPTGVGRVGRLADDPPPFTCMLPSGWNYLRPDRSPGMSSALFPNGAERKSDGVFVPDNGLFLACAKATWTVSLEDALRVACSD
jgi:hypothetical protein